MNFRPCSADRYEVLTQSAEETASLGEQLGKAAYPGLAILLFGELGAGKTVLTQGIGKSLSSDTIKSPTFIIVAEHEGELPLTHVDLYRLDTPRDTDALDLESYMEEGSVLVVEWAERWPGAPEEDVWKISYERSDTDHSRRLTIQAFGARAREALQSATIRIEAICGENI